MNHDTAQPAAQAITTAETEGRPAIPQGYMEDAKGRLWPEKSVKATDKLQDQLVRKIFGYADDLSAQIARFKIHTNADIRAFQDLIDEQYGAKIGGNKGNVTFTSFDGRLRVAVAIADNLEFGPELQAAKALIDECIEDWSEGANENIRALVNHAFQTDKAGNINRESVLSLRRMQVDDKRWQNAMQAIADSIRVVGSKQYIRIYSRPAADAKWQLVPLDLAGV
ncbi:MAG: DUF3164 family protein [Inquilinus sp.]|nr:DUF3164 family protein [Inquilinus sp.]